MTGAGWSKGVGREKSNTRKYDTDHITGHVSNNIPTSSGSKINSKSLPGACPAAQKHRNADRQTDNR